MVTRDPALVFELSRLISGLVKIKARLSPCIFCSDTRIWREEVFFDSYTTEREYESIKPCPHCLDQYDD